MHHQKARNLGCARISKLTLGFSFICPLPQILTLYPMHHCIGVCTIFCTIHLELGTFSETNDELIISACTFILLTALSSNRHDSNYLADIKGCHHFQLGWLT